MMIVDGELMIMIMVKKSYGMIPNLVESIMNLGRVTLN